MLDALWWLLAAEAIGLAAFPIAYYLLPSLKDRGYSVSKPLGIVLIGYSSWILSQLYILPSVRLSLVGLLLVMAAVSGWLVWSRRREFRDFVVRERLVIIASECIFLTFFLGWTIFRAYDPAINHTEQPMDFAFLNASMESHLGAPEDPWLRGESVSYYYFGYWMMGAVSQIAGIASNVSYNLAMALIPAMGAMGMFGLVYTIVRSGARRWREGIIAGCAAVILLGIVANLEGVLEFMRANAIGGQGFWDWAEIKLRATDPASVLMTRLDAADVSSSWAPQEFFWWFRASRVIDTFDGSGWLDMTYQEFPFFSFILGDLHPHVMSIPFAILFLALVWQFFKSPIHVWRKPNVRSYLTILAIALALGALAFTNLWDLPTFFAVLLGVAALKAYTAHGGGVWTLARHVAPIGAMVLGLAFILFLPYVVTFRTSVSGIGLITETTTRPLHLFIVWGLYLVAVTPFVMGMFWQTLVRDDWRRFSLIALAVGFLPYVAWASLHLARGGTSADLLGRFFHVLPFALLISVAVYSALWLAKWRGSSGEAFSLVLAAVALLLIMGPELLFVDDLFGPPSERTNTVFKLYYQAWILLAASSGFAIYYWRSLSDTLSGWKRSLTFLWAGVFVVLLAGSLYYPPAAAASKGGPADKELTLDGLAFVARERKAEYNAIQFVKENVSRGSGILEAVGEWNDAGRISASTGVPTVFNWPGHQIQWRGSAAKFDGREEAVARIYQTQDVEEAKTLLAQYDVEYVYVGPRERGRYGTEGLGKFFDIDFVERVFTQDDVDIYRVVR